jgi:hypothetical protein
MSYFKSFPQILYSFDTGQTVTAFAMTDILRRVKANTRTIIGTLSYDEYDIQDGETPEIIADKVYNDPTLHWVILLLNEIIDPRFDWPLDVEALRRYITSKYGAGNEESVHHFVNELNDIVHPSYTGGAVFFVTNTVHEEQVNETKRRIRLIKPQFVNKFVDSFREVLNNGQ